MYYELLTILQIALGLNIGLKESGYIRNLALGLSEKNKDIEDRITNTFKNTEALHKNNNHKTNEIDEFEFLEIKDKLNNFKKGQTAEQQEKIIFNLVEKNKIAINNTIYFILTIIIWVSLENSILKLIDNCTIKTTINMLWLSYTIFIPILNVCIFIPKKQNSDLNIFIPKKQNSDLSSSIPKKQNSFLSSFIPKKQNSVLKRRILIIVLLVISFIISYSFYTYFFFTNDISILIFKLILILNSFLAYIIILLIINSNRRKAKSMLKKIENKSFLFFDDSLEKFLKQ